MTQIDRLIEIARRELGYTENPAGSNRTKYGAAYGVDGQPEEWRPVVGYESRYEVSNMGRVRNRDGHILSPIERGGYLCLNLCDNGTRKDRKIHRLVAMAFIPNPDGLPDVNHRDEDKHNNSMDNLEWCTTKYNANYGTRNARVSAAATGKKKSWSAAGMENLRKSHSKPVIGIHTKTGEIVRFASATEADRHGFDRWGVQRAANGHMKSYRGYEWHKESEYELASGY